MEGLLAHEDFASLSRQPGFDLLRYRNLRRLRTFRQYLIRLVSDFNLVHLRARGAIVLGAEDRSDLVSKLIRLKFRFWMSLMRAEVTYLPLRPPQTAHQVATCEDLSGANVAFGNFHHRWFGVLKRALKNVQQSIT
jgi:hypothetical protein